MPNARSAHELSLVDVRQSPSGDHGVDQIELVTDRGTIACRAQHAEPGDSAVLWVFGAGGGFHGPAGGLYDRLGAQLAPEGIGGLQVAYRHPAHLPECVHDVLLAIDYLVERGRTRIVLVGHSFGGAVVITAGDASESAIAVAALSSQTAGTEAAARLTPRPLLVAHGTADEVLPFRCSRDIYERAAEPKRIVLYPGCRHGLDSCRDELDADLAAWIREVVARPTPG